MSTTPAIHLHLSNNPARLAEVFHTAFSSAWTDPMQPPTLIVPNRHIDKWLKLQLSRAHGTVLGVSGTFMERFLWETLVRTTGAQVQEIDGPLMEETLLSIMDDAACMAEPGLEPLGRYLRTNDEGPGRVARRIGLAARLAGLFLEYEYSRPDLYDNEGERRFRGIRTSWPSRDYFGGRGSDMEAWQRRLYGVALERIARCMGPSWKTLPGILGGAECTPSAVRVRAEASGRLAPVFIFGMSGMSLFHRQILMGVSQAVDVHVFTLNPCSEFWEDVDTTRSQMRSRVGQLLGPTSHAGLRLSAERWRDIEETDVWENSSLFDDPADNRLLQLWGHAGKENIALWCQASEYRFFEWYDEPNRETLLDEVKRSLLYRRTEARQRRVPDDTLRIFSAPGMRREVETMRDYVLNAMRQDPTLTPGDIGVYVTDVPAYRAALHEVLDEHPPGSAQHIPWALADENTRSSLYAAAVAGIIRLAEGRFARSEVFAFLRNPLVMAAIDADAATVDTWERWAVQLGVSHGFDAAHRRALGEHAPSSQHTWKRAIDRLLCGRLSDQDLTATDDDPERTVRPYADVAASDRDAVALFAATIETLYRDVTLVAIPRSTWTDAATRFRAVVEAWTAFPDEHAGEQRIAGQFYESLKVIEYRDRLGGQPRPLDATEFLMRVEGLCTFELPVRAGCFAGTLTIMEIKPSRPLPFRAVYVLGMNEGLFPGAAARDTLDLRTSRFVPGDLRLFRQKQYAFLEIMASAGERLAVSFVGRDIVRDEPLLPCSTVYELQSFVNDAIVAPATNDSCTLQFVEVPLVPEQDGAARGGAARDSEPSTSPATPPGQTAEDELRVSTRRLRAFLLNPLESTLRYGLSLQDDGSDADATDDTEPFVSGSLTRWQLLDRVAARVASELLDGGDATVPPVAQGADLHARWIEILDGVYRDALVNGATPEGVFAALDCGELHEPACTLCDAIAGYARTRTGWLCEHRGPDLAEVHSRARQWIEVPIDGATVRVSAEPRLVLRNPSDPTQVEIPTLCASNGTVGRGTQDEVTIQKYTHVLEPFLMGAAMVAGSPLSRVSVALIGFGKDFAWAACAHLPIALAEEASQEYLRCLLRDMRDPHRSLDHLPFEAIEKLYAGPGTPSGEHIAEWLDEQADAFRPAYTMRLEALRAATRIVPAGQQCTDIVTRRFPPLFAGRAVQ